MAIKPDHWIRRMCQEKRMIEPFEEKLVRQGVISYGLSSYGYDVRVADEFKIFTNVNSTVLDPKQLDPRNMVDFKGDVCIVPPNSFALARTVEYFRVPRNVLCVCVGKCVAAGTRVVDSETGDWLPIEEVVRERRVRTLGLERWRLAARDVTTHAANGRKAVWKVCLRSGLEIRLTAEHPLRTIRGWSRLCDLASGARIAVAREAPVFGREPLAPGEATLLGLMISDGQCRTPGSSPRFTTGDPAIAGILAECATTMGFVVSRVGRYGWNLVNHRGRGGRPEPNRAYRWLQGHGMACKASGKHVPRAVFRAPEREVAAFLRALFSGDGSVYGANGAVHLEYASISRRLVEDVRHLLLRFGIFTLLRTHRTRDGYVSHRVLTTDRSMIARFAERIGFLPDSDKARRLAERLAAPGAGERVKSNFDTLPSELWSVMLTAARGAGRSMRSLGTRHPGRDQSVNVALAERVGRELQHEHLLELAEADVVWDTIESIEPDGDDEVFDLEVPAGSNFLANDVVVHNSTYARCGIITNVTPFEPEWEGHVTLEISNTTPLPAKIYAGEGLAQVLFLESDEPCEVSYGDRAGKYQKQTGITLPRI